MGGKWNWGKLFGNIGNQGKTLEESIDCFL